MLRKEIQTLRSENNQLRAQVNSSGTPPYPASAPGPPGPVGAQPPPPGPYGGPDPFSNTTRTELPPLRSLGAQLPVAPESMTGVQYESSRPPSFRSDRF